MPPQNQPLQPLPPVHHSSGAVIPAIITLLITVGIVGAAYYFGYINVNLGAPSTSQEVEKQEMPELVPSQAQQQTVPSTIRDGLYALTGSGAGGSYAGTVSIRRRDGKVNIFDLRWEVGNSGQIQIGVGILEKGVLSVGYADTTSGTVNDAGAVAYVATDSTHLKGTWTSVAGGDLGTEELVWRSELQ